MSSTRTIRMLAQMTLLAWVLSPGVASAGAKKYVENGNKHFFKLEYERALEKYAKADEKMEVKDREYAIAMLNIASAHRRLGNHEQALVYLDKASEKIWGAKSGWQSLNLGFGTGLLTNESKQEWIGTENERVFIRLYAALSALELGRWDDAVIDLKMCEKLSENYPIVRYLHGFANARIAEERENAAVHFKAAQEVAENKAFERFGGGAPYPTLQLARLSWQDGDTATAEGLWQKALPRLEGNPLQRAREQFLGGGNNLVLVVEKGWTPNVAKDKTRKCQQVRVVIDESPAGGAHVVDYSGKHDRTGVGDALASGLAAAATEELKQGLVQGAANAIPGGGIVAGLLMGGRRARSVASWDKIAPVLYLYETYLPPGSHHVRVELTDAKGKVVAQADRTVQLGSGPTFASLALAIKK